MTEIQFLRFYEELVAMRKAMEGINETLQKLSKPPRLIVPDGLSDSDLESPIDPHFFVKPERPPSKGFATSLDTTYELAKRRNVIAVSLDKVNGKGFSYGTYTAELLRHMRNGLSPETLTMIQMENYILAHTGNTMHGHWENQREIDPNVADR